MKLGSSSPPLEEKRSLQKRKGGGGGKGGGAKGGGGGGGKGGSSGFSGRGGYIPLGSGTSKSASAYGPGGGSRGVIGSGVPFAGREIGGGTRGEVFGTPRYGSGFPYGVGGTFVSGRPFPFGFWPLYWGPGIGGGYYGHSEYGPHDNSSRPGGQLQTALIRSTSWPNTTTSIISFHSLTSRQANNTNITTNATSPYYITGDQTSVQAVLDALVQNCSVVNTTLTIFDPPSTFPKPEQVIQYFRSSSFSLSLDGYNDTANLPSSAPSDNSTNPPPLTADTPLPSVIDHNFLNCINQTIGQAVPITDGAMRLQANFVLFWIFWMCLSFTKFF